MDQLGGSGNGAAWFSANDAKITDHPLYHKYSQQSIGDFNAATLKADMKAAVGSSEASPILNYLNWVLSLVVAVA